jgi:hypothetical protein
VTSWWRRGMIKASDRKTPKGYRLYDASEVERLIIARNSEQEAQRQMRKLQLTVWGTGITHVPLD